MIKKIKQLLIKLGSAKFAHTANDGKNTKKSPLDEFLGLYEGKIDLTTEEYLKIRKGEASLAKK